MVDQGNNFYLLSLSILITCLLDSVIFFREKFCFNHFWELRVNKIPIWLMAKWIWIHGFYELFLQVKMSLFFLFLWLVLLRIVIL